MALKESELWRKLKNASKRITWTRLENWALFGTPDLLGYAPSGNFFTLELKSITLKNPNFVRFSGCLCPGAWALPLVPWFPDPGARRLRLEA